MSIKKGFNLILSTCLILFVSATFVIQSPANAASTSLEQQKKQTRDKINHLKWLESVEKNKLQKNQVRLEVTANDLQYSKQKYDTTQSKLSGLESNLNRSMYEFSAIDYQMKRRVRQVFKTQRKGFFQLLLSAQDFNMFLDRIYFEGLVIKGDYKRMLYAKQKAREIASLKNQIEEQRRVIARSIKQINSDQKYIQRSIAKNERMIHKLRTDRRAYEQAERELAQQSSSIQTMISKTSQDSQIKVVSGFIKPIAGRITSPFGWRTHPIFNSRTFHSGIDIGGQFRGGIRASNSGKVIFTGWYGGYGKVVIIDHGIVSGQPITTLYAHMDAINVSQGAYVNKGQVVGLEGTTGYSTGPHLHFEVRVNGKPVNPLNYI